MPRNKTRKLRNIPVTLEDGTKTFVQPNSIPESGWTRHHGVTAAGDKVESLKTYKVPGSNQILVSQGDDNAIIRTSMGELEILFNGLFGSSAETGESTSA